MITSPPEKPAAAPHAALDAHDALPPGTRFGELEILRVLGVGGFGIVYLAQDHALERKVALKEYMPTSLAARGQGRLVSLRSGAHTETYALGLRSFVNEARLLARFNHPSLVKVYRFWEENGTAYMVMPFLQGSTLRDVRRSMSAAPTETWMRSVIAPLLDALDELHREDVYHRDIAPDNILLPPGELPVLLDFGAARRAIGDSTQTFTAILKPSYAPIEQYAEVVQLRQGPWTDLYALGAVAYYLLQGKPPPPATARAVQDDVPLLAPEQHPTVSPAFIAAVEWALAIRPADRPQSIAALRDVLDGRAAVPPRSRGPTTLPPGAPMRTGPGLSTFAPTVRLDLPADDEATTIEPTRPMTRPPRTAPPAAPRRADATTVMPGRPVPDAPEARPAARSHVGWWVSGFAALLVVAVGAAWMIGARSASPARAQAPAVRPVPLAAPSLAQPATPEPAVAATPVPRTAPAAVAATATPARPTPAHAPRPTAKALATRATEASPEASQPGPTAAPAAEDDDESMRASLGFPLPVPSRRDGPATPKQACGGRVFVALALCMEEQCEQPRFKGHPQCRKVHELVERRKRGEAGD